MTTRRSSFTKKAALRYVAYYDKLIEQLKNTNARPAGMFLAVSDFGNVKVSTLHNRFRDALNWLRQHNIEPNQDRRADYEYLAAVIRVEDRATGINIALISGPRPEQTIRAPEAELTVADWKESLEDWVSNSTEPVKVFENCTIYEENLQWLKKICGGLGISYHVEGDKITLARN